MENEQMKQKDLLKDLQDVRDLVGDMNIGRKAANLVEIESAINDIIKNYIFRRYPQ